MNGAVDHAPSSSVHQGSRFEPAELEEGATAGISDRLALVYRAPGQFTVDVLRLVGDDVPSAAKNKGKLLIRGCLESQALYISDGSGWLSLTLGVPL